MLPDLRSSNPLADIYRRLDLNARLIKEIGSTSRTLEAAWIGAGGVTVAKDGLLRFLNDDEIATMTLGRGYLEMVDPATSGAMRLRRGRIYLWDNYETNPDNPGLIMVDQGAGVNHLRMFPPYESGTGLENSFTVRGRTATQTGAVWVYTDGNILLSSDLDTTVTTRKLILNPTDGVMTIYNLPTTSGGYLMRYNNIGGEWTLALDSSSRRYKTNIADADIDPADVLKWRPRRWQDINQGDDAPWNTGLIAEEVDEAGTPEFVIFDDEGRPDGIRKEILAVGQQVVLQDHEARIVELEQTVANQAEAIAALTARLEALEARP